MSVWLGGVGCGMGEGAKVVRAWMRRVCGCEVLVEVGVCDGVVWISEGLVSVVCCTRRRMGWNVVQSVACGVGSVRSG